MPAIGGLATNREGEKMRSLILAVLIVVMLPVAAAAQASDKDIVVPRNHPATDLASYAKYENVLDGIARFADRYAAQQDSLKEQLVGAWTLVSADIVRNDGSKIEVFGPNPKGTLIYTSDGHFALVQMRSDLPKLASNSRDRGTSEENQAVVQGSITYFGTYAVNEAEKVITLQLEASTFANLVGGGEQKRLITSITADELKFVNPRTPSGSTLEVGWKRAR